MRTTIRSVTLLAALAAGLAACGKGDDALPKDFQRRLNADVGDPKPDAKPQARGQFDVPSMEDEGAPLSLSGNDPLVVYDGTLLFWNAEQVTPPQIARIATSSTNLRAKRAAFIDLAASTVPGLRAALAQKEAEVAGNAEAINAARQDTDPAHVRAAMQEFVDGWFGERLDLAQDAAALDATTRVEVEAQFHRYCEYKLWELATSQLALQKFKHRPSPLSLCEPYYATRSYFAVTETAPECAEASAGGDWFDCIWKQGVLKSAMLQQLAAHEPEGRSCAASGAARVKAIEGWLVPEQDGSSLLRKMVADNNKFQNKRLADMLVQEGYPTLKTLLTASAGRTFRSTFPYVERFATCPEAFAVKGQRGPDPVAMAIKLNAKSPQASAQPVTIAELKNIGENLAPSQSEEALFAALPGREAQAEQVLKLVVAPLTAYSERLASGLGDNIRASYDDYAMNELETGPIPLPETHNGLLAIEGRIEANNQKAAFGGLRKVEERILRRHYGHLLVAKERLAREVEAARADLDNAIRQLAPALQEVQSETSTGTLALLDAGATTYFNQLRLELATAAGKLVAALKVANGDVIKGCSDFDQVVACGNVADEAVAQFRSISFDGETGRLTLETVLDQPAAQGFAALPRGSEPGKFSEIPPESVKGLTLRLEVYANRLSDNFRFITGKAFLMDAAGDKVHEGSFSADTYAADKSRLEL